jgi:hypothetical protein
MTRLTFICHGATAAIRQARFPLDEALDYKDMIVAMALAPALPSAERIMTRPSLLARQTADARLRGAAHQLRLGRFTGCLRGRLFETDRLIDERLAECVGKGKHQDASDQARQHAAKQKSSNHVSNSPRACRAKVRSGFAATTCDKTKT